MLTLQPSVTHKNLVKMDWITSPKKEVKSEPEDNDNSQEASTEDAVARHFGESLRRLSQQKSALTSNGYHPQTSSNAFSPFVRLNKVDANAVDLKPEIGPQQHIENSTTGIKIEDNAQEQSVSSTSQRKDHLTDSSSSKLSVGQYDVENISQILKTFDYNCFLNSTILKQEIKTESPDSTDNISSGSNPNPIGGGAIIWPKKIKQGSPLLTVNTDVDIEAELPCTSIKQRPTPKKKNTRSRKNGAVPKEKPVIPPKQTSKRTSKRKTNYREASSEDEHSAAKSSRNKSGQNAIKTEKTESEAALPILSEVKTESMDTDIVDQKIKTEIESDVTTEIATEIKTENIADDGSGVIHEIKPENETGPEAEIKTEIKTELETETGTGIVTEIKTEIEKEAETEIKKEDETGTDTGIIEEIKVEAVTKIKTEVEAEAEAEAETAILREIKTEADPETVTAIKTEVEARVETTGVTDFKKEVEAGEEVAAATEIKTEVEAGNETSAVTEIKTEVEDGTETAAVTEIKTEVEDEAEAEAASVTEIKTEVEGGPEAEAATVTEIKTEVKDEAEAAVITEIKAEVEAGTETETETGTITEIKTEIETGTETEIKKEIDSAIKSENEIGTENAEIKTELSSENVDQDIKVEPSTEATTSAENKKPVRQKRVRNPAAVAAAAKNKNKLHPLTRKEQMMMNKLIESKQPFLQNVPCLKLASRVSKCRECRCASFRSDSVFCRFYDFRRLRFKEKAVLLVDGFSDPHKDPGPNDINLWMPGPAPKDIDLDISRFILMHVGDQFCRIWQEEQSATEEHMSANKTIAWKKVVKGVREICDVCETTLFNFHWTCSKCGFGVCIDCYKDRKRNLTKKLEKPPRGFDDYGWLVCTFREDHVQEKLMLTQIIPGNALNFLAHRLHEVCKLWKIPQKCGCPLSTSIKEENFTPQFVESANKIIKDAYLRFYSRECEIKYRENIKGLNPRDLYDNMSIMEAETKLIEEASSAGTLPVVLVTTLKHLKLTPHAHAFAPTISEADDVVTKEYKAVKAGVKSQKYLPQKIMTSRLSRQMFPGIEHDWLCNGKLLRLLDSRNQRNVMIFQEVWKRGQPVMVSELCKFLDINLWRPEAFCRDFGEKKNDLINCMTGNLVPNQPMKLFWEGFQCVSKRLLDSQGQPMLLKLKDWPPGDDFAEILPTRFADLMGALPLPEYTLRTGCLNIASRLPNIFVPPDLGPKMYNAYGSALHPDKGTTNLHLDISDAVNIMVYVGIPSDASAKAQIKAAMRAIDGGGCDIATRRRVRAEGVLPGALWHIYSARDADKIRDLLNRVTIERGYRLEPDHDPIHDQNWYLDNELRERLYDDYGVEGYPIVQCLGDAVFIPAGAPHQVRNLHNCIKVAEDFVSPENIQHCFHLSQQFRKLSMSHTNHEDKLQIRNVIYHAVKDTTSYLTYLLNRTL